MEAAPASGQRRGRNPGPDSREREPEGQEDSVEEGRHGLCKDSKMELRLIPGRREAGRVH